MSYIEHGPRIFYAGRPSNAVPLNYGDYVLPRKRSEGRLKMYDSCSDIRAWSPNPMENSRYFRELAEHAPRAGKVVPFNVLIDNLIKMGSEAQDELELVKQELEKYKSLKLTPEQKEHLKRIAKSFNEGCKDQKTNQKGRSLSKIILDTFLSGSRENLTEEERVRQLEICSVIENKDVSIQVQPAVSESSVQYEFGVEDNISSDFSSTTTNSTVRIGKSSCSENSGIETAELSENESETSRSIYESEINKTIIIEKESKIIALENEVQAKNAELEERDEKIKSMRKSVISMTDVLDQKCQEVEDLRTKLHIYKYEKRKLQDSLDNQSRVSEAQLDEINRLRFRIDQEVEIRNDLSKQLEKMRRERDGFLRKLDMLQQEVKDKNETLATNEKELQELFLSWQRTTEEHEKSKAKAMEVLRILETEIEEKNSRNCEYEAQILNIEQEVGDMFIMLKTSLSEIEFIDKYEIECNSDSNENQNIVSQAKATISNFRLWIKEYETERKDLLKQLDDLKNGRKCIESDYAVRHTGTYVNYESSTDYEETPKYSEVEITNFNLDKNEDRPLSDEISTNFENSQDRLETQVTDQESTIEMWNWSFDKKIDAAFESHATTSIFKIIKLTEGFKDVEIEKMKEIEELKSEINKRDLEITKLRSQIIERNAQWKGEGDCYEREEADHKERELELKEKVQTYQHKLLGVNEENFTLSTKVKYLQEEKQFLIEKYEKVHQELQLRNREWAINEKYKKKFGEMQSRLRGLQAENESLTVKLSEANKEIEKKNQKIQELLDEEEDAENIIVNYRVEIQTINSEIKYLKQQNYQLNVKLQKTLKNSAKLEEYKLKNNRNVEELTQFQEEVRKLNEEKCRLENKNADLKTNFLEHQKENVELERELEEIMSENKKLRKCITILENQIETMVEKEIRNKKSMNYSNILLDNIASLQEKLDNCKLEEEDKQEKIILINRFTSMDKEFELNFSKDLSKEKEKIRLENESRQKEDEIEKLKLELDKRNLEIQNMEEKHKQSLIMVTRNKDEELKKLRNLHHQNIQNLKTSFNSFNSEGFSFGTEDWLKTLSTEELLGLCQRVSSLIPSEEFLKTMNNKQNKYLQHDMSEKQKLIEKVIELEYEISEIKQNMTSKVEELESAIQEERNKSTKLQKRLHSLSQNQGHIQVNQIKKRNQSSKSFHLIKGINKELHFPYCISDQECIKSNRFFYNQSGKRRNYLERKSLSGDESINSRRYDFIHRCSTSMRHK